MTSSSCITPEVLSEGGAVFAEPWQAQVFAMAVQFSDAGLFTWKEWAEVFSAEIAEKEKTGYEPDRDYYHCWADALEKLLASKGHIDGAAMTDAVDETIMHWPHPEHIPQREPVAIDPAKA